MKTAKDILKDIQSSLYGNKINRYFVLGQLLLFALTLLIWVKVIVARDIYIYSSTNYFPLQIFVVVFIIHIVLSVYSYKNDKYLSNLLLGASLFYIILIFILEMLYIIYR